MSRLDGHDRKSIAALAIRAHPPPPLGRPRWLRSGKQGRRNRAGDAAARHVGDDLLEVAKVLEHDPLDLIRVVSAQGGESVSVQAHARLVVGVRAKHVVENWPEL